jgi:hypothetical protein
MEKIPRGRLNEGSHCWGCQKSTKVWKMAATLVHVVADMVGYFSRA